MLSNKNKPIDVLMKAARTQNPDDTVKYIPYVTGKLTGKRPLGRPRHRWEDNIRIDLEAIGINAGHWVDSA